MSDDPYLVEHLRAALALDQRVGEMDVEVHEHGDRVLVTGTVATAERAEQIATVAREVVGDQPVHVELRILRLGTPSVEEL